MREARGKLEITRVKTQEIELKRKDKTRELVNKSLNYLTELDSLNQQITIFEQTVDHYQTLLRGERRKFEVGESSLFLVNTREMAYINAQIKLISMKTEAQKTKALLLWATGILHQ